MPSITVSISDLSELLGRTIAGPDWLEKHLSLVKGELKGFDLDADEAKIELNDTNRPDLWCPEGIARQVKTKLTGTVKRYPFLNGEGVAGVIDVDDSVDGVRPYVAAFTAVGPAVTDGSLRQLIQTQEKLSDTFGRRRKAVATGVYKLARIAFPVRYELVGADECPFVPLGYTEPMTPARIMQEHPTAREYASAVEGYTGYPILKEAGGEVLSMPPIINSRTVGAVEVGDTDLFVEVTGIDIRQTVLAANIFAANLADRGYRIRPVTVRYSYETPLGTDVTTPCCLGQMQEVRLNDFNKALGETFEPAGVAGNLTTYGLCVEERGEGVWRVKPPFYRNDLLHVMDVVEDLAIAQGYNSFRPLLPSDFSVGRLSDIERFSDEVRALLVESGFTEILSPILTHRDKLSTNMRLPGRRIVAIANVMTENYSVLRDAVLPSLLEVESVSANAAYPHAIFEVGEVAVRTSTANMGSQTLMNCAAALFSADAGFSAVHAYLDRLFYFLDLDYQLKTRDHLSAIPGRSARVVIDGRDVGGIGEMHPEVLEKWGVKVPCAAFELNLDKILEVLGHVR